MPHYRKLNRVIGIMTVIHRTALVGYTAQQLFELVNDIKAYPHFLPWCKSAYYLQHSEQEVEASLEIAWSGIHKTFTTRNTLHPYDCVKMVLVSGPFKQLEGTWRFVTIGEQGCRISLDLTFELTGHLFDKLFQPVFHHIANSLVEAFSKRAVEVYGKSTH